jgi:hypothetical protein
MFRHGRLLGGGVSGDSVALPGMIGGVVFAFTMNASHGCMNYFECRDNKRGHGIRNILPIERCAIRFTMKPAIALSQYRRRRKWSRIFTGSAF